MKAVCVFVLTLGVCLAQDKTPPNSGHPSNSPIPRAPIPQTNTAAHHERNDKMEEATHPDNTKQRSAVTNSSTLAPASSSTTSEPVSKSTKLAPEISSTTVNAPPVYGIGHWNVTDKNGSACIMLSGDISLNLVNAMNKQIIKTFKVPTNGRYGGDCEKAYIKFDQLNDGLNNDSLQLTFGMNATTSKFYLSAVDAELSHLKNETSPEHFSSNETLYLFENPLNQSYYCARLAENLVAWKAEIHLMLKVDSFQVQAYKKSSTDKFDTAVDCEASSTSDIVPIIVGCSLAVLVILVLVAYLISRRRAQSRGYLSM